MLEFGEGDFRKSVDNIGKHVSRCSSCKDKYSKFLLNSVMDIYHPEECNIFSELVLDSNYLGLMSVDEC